jgi:hypothetical protein
MEVSRVGESADLGHAPERSPNFVHVAPNHRGKPFMLHDDAPDCRH